MSARDHIQINGYANIMKGARPRMPLVHLMISEYGDVKSISFHPDDAPRIARAILAAARTAKLGRTSKTAVPLRPQD